MKQGKDDYRTCTRENPPQTTAVSRFPGPRVNAHGRTATDFRPSDLEKKKASEERKLRSLDDCECNCLFKTATCVMMRDAGPSRRRKLRCARLEALSGKDSQKALDCLPQENRIGEFTATDRRYVLHSMAGPESLSLSTARCYCRIGSLMPHKSA